ncbi:MAG: hypothetical protein WB821_12100 [Burkholderiaceae bacterium]
MFRSYAAKASFFRCIGRSLGATFWAGKWREALKKLQLNQQVIAELGCFSVKCPVAQYTKIDIHQQLMQIKSEEM